ncbi:MAG: YqhA family protein [Flavobacteriales bacterium]|nr:YqhA family protein [Flavobacteriales bacterium]
MKYVLRIFISVISAILLIDSIILVVLGVKSTWHGFHNLLDPSIPHPMMPAFEAVDQFFMALVLFIMAIGLVQLFIGEIPFMKPASLHWLKIDSFMALKVLLWDTLLVTMLMFFLTQLVNTPVLDWSVLILPTAILMLTLCSFLLKQKH